MKRLLTLLGLLLAGSFLWAQSVPQGINYQAVIRHASGEIIPDKAVSVKVTILDVENKYDYYEEIHQVTTSAEGVVQMIIGAGTPTKGSFEQIPWSVARLWANIAYDVEGRGHYESVGVMQLLSVPYAFYAEAAGKVNIEAQENEEGESGRDSEVVEKYWKTNGNQLLPISLIITTPEQVLNNQALLPQFLGTTSFMPLQIKTADTLRAFMLPLGDFYLLKNQFIQGNLSVRGDGFFQQNVTIKGTLVGKEAEFFDLLVLHNGEINNDLHVGNDLDVDRDANIDRDLTVGGIARFNNTTQSTSKDDGAVIVEGGVGIEKNLNVGGNAAIGGTLDIGGKLTIADLTESTATNNGALVVGGGVGIGKRLNVGGVTRIWNATETTSPTNGAFIVDGGVGISKNLRLNGDLYAPRFLDANDNAFYVNPNSGSRLYDMNVTHDLTVGNNALISNIAGVGGLYGNVSFTIKSPSSVDYPFYAEVTGTSNLFTMNKDGQLYLRSTKAGPSNNTGNYAMFIDAQNQGLVMRLNDKAWPDASNKYMNFWGSGNVSRGRIEGQTLSELHNSFDYIWTNAMALADEAFVLAEGVACGIQLDAGEVIVMGAEGILVYAKWAEWLINADENCGISYSSGSGDYAEWLEKENQTDQFTFGDIVSVVGGKISRNTDRGGKLMVVSMSPIVLGNMPEAGRESAYEKIAFMGQVPVKVKGRVQPGDYILPSGNNDGFGIAVAPGTLRLEQYAQIVGVAWSVSGLSKGISLVTTAVGLNANDLVTALQAQQQELNQVKTQLNHLIAYLQSKDPSMDLQPVELSSPEPVVKPTNDKPVDMALEKASLNAGSEVASAGPTTGTRFGESNEYIERLILEKPELFLEAREYVRKKFEAAGMTWSRDSDIERLFTDETFMFEKVRAVAN